MIPKKIHYCWFGGKPLSKDAHRCIDSWKKYCPDYEIIRWDESNYDVTKNKYMMEAYNQKKWAFVSDYARLDVVYSEGGLYLDTDVELIKNIDVFFAEDGFMGFEDGKHVSPGLCTAAKKHHPTIKEMMDEIYSNRSFFKEDGTIDDTPSPSGNTAFLLKRGLVQNNQKQTVAGITIFPKDYFCPMDYKTGKLTKTENTYAIHWFSGSWQTPHQKAMHTVEKILGENRYKKLVDIKNRIFKK